MTADIPGEHSDQLAGCVAVVTGGAQGIGRSVAFGLARHGADIAVIDRERDVGQQTCREIEALGRRAALLEIDLGDTDRVPSAVADIVATFGGIDIVVNAAGVEGGREPFLDLSLTTWERTLRVDLTAPFLMMQHCGRVMIAGGRGGRIVNVSSSAAFRAEHSQVDYSAAKAGIVGLTRAAAGQLAAHDINVNCVAPGLTATPTIASTIDPSRLDSLAKEGPLANLFGRVSTPDDVAAAIVFLCLPASRQITAQAVHTSAGAVM